MTRPIARSLQEVIRSRFGKVIVSGPVLLVGNIDQAAGRALLTLLWDAGLEIRSGSVAEAGSHGH